MEKIFDKLNGVVDRLIEEGVTTFISGGALGFDQIIIEKKKSVENVYFMFALPCKNQEALWNESQKELYRSLLIHEDEIIYVSDEYEDGFMKKRNQYMVDRSNYCICAFSHYISGTGQTVRYAQREGIEIINVIE